MALQTSGSISLYDIRDEFEQSNPVPLQDYYRGGGIVPDISANSSIPTSGSISVQDFYGAMNLSPFTVYHGTDSVPDTYNEITLPTPVPVGESFIMVSATGTEQPRRTHGKWTLIDASGGNWTKMKAEFTNAHNDRMIHWQVVTCPDFNVQQIELSPSGTSHNQSISSVNFSSTFVYHTNVHSSRLYESAYSATLTSSTNVNFERTVSGSASWDTTLFVVDWAGADVSRTTINLSSASTTTSVSGINRNSSFVLYSFSTSQVAGDIPESSDALTRMYLSSDTTLETQRGTSGGSLRYYIQIISHPLISVQYDTATSAFSSVNFSISSVDTSRSFIALNPIFGNGYTPSGNSGGLELGFNRWNFTSSTNAQKNRFLTNGRDIALALQVVSS